MDNIDLSKAVTQNIFSENSISANILRLDLIHNVISGNKYFKLKYHIDEALKKGFKNILTYGGAYSNHIIATALSGQVNKLKTIGVIRGERPENLSHTLQNALDYDMQLKFISRSDFKNRNNLEFLEALKSEFGDFYMVPEGGDSELGRLGSKEILELTDYKKYTHIISSIGTGTMYFGLVNSSDLNQKIIGIPALKGMDNFLSENSYKIENKEKYPNCHIIANYHFNGYAKKNQILIDFMNQFYQKTKIPTDFVYTGKLIYAFFDLIKNDYFPQNSQILLIHSGGLQGNLSLKNQENKSLLLF